MGGSEYGGSSPAPFAGSARARPGVRLRSFRIRLRKIVAVGQRLGSKPLAVIAIPALFLVVYLMTSLSDLQATVESSHGELSGQLEELTKKLAAETKAKNEIEQELKQAQAKIEQLSKSKEGLERRVKSAEGAGGGGKATCARCPNAKMPTYVFGIPSVYRPTENYLQRTIENVLEKVPEEDRGRAKFVILNGESPPEKHLEITAIKEKYKSWIDSGFLHILENEKGHKELEGELKLTHGDPIDRVRWRSKQVLDFALLMDYARERGDYYVQMEDDIIAARNWFGRMEKWLLAHWTERCDWLMLSYYTPWNYKDKEEYFIDAFYGFIGQMYRTRDLEALVKNFRERFNDSPVDWLMVDYLKASGRKIFAHIPSIFKHIGTISSLNGKRQEQNVANFAEDLGPDQQGEFADG